MARLRTLKEAPYAGYGPTPTPQQQAQLNQTGYAPLPTRPYAGYGPTLTSQQQAQLNQTGYAPLPTAQQQTVPVGQLPKSEQDVFRQMQFPGQPITQVQRTNVPAVSAGPDYARYGINQDWAKANPRLAQAELARAQQRQAGGSVFDKNFRSNVINPILYPKQQRTQTVPVGQLPKSEQDVFRQMQFPGQPITQVQRTNAPAVPLPTPQTQPAPPITTFASNRPLGGAFGVPTPQTQPAPPITTFASNRPLGGAFGVPRPITPRAPKPAPTNPFQFSGINPTQNQTAVRPPVAPVSSVMRQRSQVLNQGMEYDAFDVILEYLSSGGHVDTLEEALYVMMEMDEYTISNIMEDYQAHSLFEEINQWVNSLVYEGYDFSNYTWDEIIEYYINEGVADKRLPPEERAKERNKRAEFVILDRNSPAATRARRKEHRVRRGVRGNIGGEGGSSYRYDDNADSDYPSFTVRGRGHA